MMKLSASFVILAALVRAGCVPVNNERIRGSDLAAANAAFASIAPDEVIGFAPSPGRLRLLGPRELARLAARYGVKADSFQQICFERVTEPLTAARIVPALKKTLGLPDIEIHVLDFSRYPLPPGQLEFTRAGLPAAPPPNTDAGIIWRGRVIVTEHRSIPVWARVKLLVAQQWVEAATNLPAGRPIAAGQVIQKSGKQFPTAHPGFKTIADVVGRKPSRLIRAGQIVSAAMLKDPDEIERGDSVSVQVLSGGAQLSFKARAESSGGMGQTIAVQNPVSGKRFVAVVQEKGKVLVNSNARNLENDNGVAGNSSAASGGSMGGRLESVR